MWYTLARGKLMEHGACRNAGKLFLLQSVRNLFGAVLRRSLSYVVQSSCLSHIVRIFRFGLDRARRRLHVEFLITFHNEATKILSVSAVKLVFESLDQLSIKGHQNRDIQNTLAQVQKIMNDAL